MESDDRSEKLTMIESTFRNGSITAIGIILAFSLGFVTQWAANPVPWRLVDILAVAPLVLGLLVQMKAMAELLDVNSLRVENYNRARRHFLFGFSATSLGVGVALALDVISDEAPRLIR